MALIERKIQIAIKLAQGTGANQPSSFAGTNSNTITLSNHRASVRVQNSGGLAGSGAQVDVWGMTPSLMNQLSTLGMVLQLVPGNKITVTAGDDLAGMATVFTGTTRHVTPNYNDAPDVSVEFECFAGAAEAAAPYPASSFTGATDVATILSGIANKMGWGFENSGVSITLPTPYFSGSAWEQVQRVREQANIRAELINGVLAIWPMYGNRPPQGVIPLISKTTGMIGYPSFTADGIMVKTLFDPRVFPGGQIKVESAAFTAQNLARVNNLQSLWNVLSIDLDLAAQMPNGPWMSAIRALNPGSPIPIPQQAPA